MAVPTFSSEITLVADGDELRISGPQHVCFLLKEFLELKGLATGVLKIINHGTSSVYSTAEFEADGKSGNEVKELIEAFLSEKEIRFRIVTIPNPPHGFESVFRLLDISVFRQH